MSEGFYVTFALGRIISFSIDIISTPINTMSNSVLRSLGFSQS